MKGFIGSGVFVAALFAAACGGTPPPDMMQTESLCDRDTRADTYVAGLAKTGTKMSVKLLDSDPGPPIKGVNKWMVEVRDETDTLMTGTQLTVTPFMPDHNHGSSVKPTITELSNGQYEIDNVYLFMPGLWEVRIVAPIPNDMSMVREAKFAFCVDG